jgi:hypothetical protein
MPKEYAEISFHKLAPLGHSALSFAITYRTGRAPHSGQAHQRSSSHHILPWKPYMNISSGCPHSASEFLGHCGDSHISLCSVMPRSPSAASLDQPFRLVAAVH